MGKNTKGFNWKARQVSNTTVHNTEQVLVELPEKGNKETYDEANPMVLPSEKRPTVVVKPQCDGRKKIITKKERKHLQGVVDRKKKKENRAALLESLSKVQVSDDMLEQLTSIADSNTKGLKRLSLNDDEDSNNSETFRGKPKYRKADRTCGIKGTKKKNYDTSETWSSHPLIQLESSDEDVTFLGFEPLTPEEKKEAMKKRQQSSRARSALLQSKKKIVKGGGADKPDVIPKGGDKPDAIAKGGDKPDAIAKGGGEGSDLDIQDQIHKVSKGHIVSVKKRKRQVEESSDEEEAYTEGHEGEPEEAIEELEGYDEESDDEITVKDVVKVGNERKKDVSPEADADEDEADSNNIEYVLAEDDEEQEGAAAAVEDEEEEGGGDKEQQAEEGDSDMMEEDEVVEEVISEQYSSGEEDTEMDENLGSNLFNLGQVAQDDVPDGQSIDTSIHSVFHLTKDRSNIHVERRTERLVNNVPYVPVYRKPAVQVARRKLPILADEQTVMEAINSEPVVVISGHTGSGKTTQVPQLLYEAGYCLNGKIIGITEPRRVAAISMSARVAEEMNFSSEVVSYAIRFEGNAGPNTQIKFMTDGVLLKEIQRDFMLTKYSVIIVDEAHERTLYTDIAIGLLSRIATLRNKNGDPFKFIIMSATLDVEDFLYNKALFRIPPPLVKIEGRTYKVGIHFNKVTPENYMLEAYKKACKIHSQLPAGGILIFVTGQREVNALVRKLRAKYPYYKKGEQNTHCYKNVVPIDEDVLHYKNIMKRLYPKNKSQSIDPNLWESLTNPVDDTDIDIFEDDDDLTDQQFEEIFIGDDGMYRHPVNPMWVLPFYSLLPHRKQQMVFQPAPAGTRLCIVATNIAETSITIPNIKYVIDAGRCKKKYHESYSGISVYDVGWISKASAIQRAGRAGRTRDGHCYRLYSSAVYEGFVTFNDPEITSVPLDDIVLQMKCLRIDRISNFPFPTPINRDHLLNAHQRLVKLGALTLQDETNSKLTPLGESMAEFGITARFSKMLCLSHQRDMLPVAITIIAGLATDQALIEYSKKYLPIWESWLKTSNCKALGDMAVLYAATNSLDAHCKGRNLTVAQMEELCVKVGFRYKAILDIRKLRLQLIKEINLNVQTVTGQIPLLCASETPLTDEQAFLMRQIILAGSVDKVARRKTLEEMKEAQISATAAAYAIDDEEFTVFIHSSSVLHETKPEWIVYQEAFKDDKYNAFFILGVTSIQPEWLLVFAPQMCRISDPLKEPAPYYNEEKDQVMCYVTATYGKHAWPIPVSQIEYPAGEDRYKWFAKFLLDGTICPLLEPYVPYLLSPADSIVKSWSLFLYPEQQLIAKALMNKNIDNYSKLCNLWRIDKTFLLKEFQLWFPQSSYKDVKQIWPPVIL